jgi:hypothetical protein
MVYGTALPSNIHGKRLVKSLAVSPSSLEIRNSSNKRLKEDDCSATGNAQLSGMPEDVTCNITSYLDIHSLLTMRVLNRTFRTLASSPKSGWDHLCDALWKNKIHVLPQAQDWPDRMEAYRMSVTDARDRDYILREELVFDPVTNTGTVWSFRFKESAGEDWTAWDPWFNGLPCRKMVFLDDGTVKQAETLQDPTFSSSEQGHQPSNTNNNHNHNHQLIDPPVSMQWRFLTRPLDMSAKPTGSYIRFQVGGRDVPTYCIRRSPTKNWGFVMESCWG